MSINKKINDLISAIKNSKEYNEFIKAKEDLINLSDKKIILNEYKQILAENQLEQFTNGFINKKQKNKMEKMYEELSKHEVINRYLMAEYCFKNILTNISKDLSSILDKENNIVFY